jgi:hypothetical protein
MISTIMPVTVSPASSTRLSPTNGGTRPNISTPSKVLLTKRSVLVRFDSAAVLTALTRSSTSYEFEDVVAMPVAMMTIDHFIEQWSDLCIANHLQSNASFLLGVELRQPGNSRKDVVG